MECLQQVYLVSPELKEQGKWILGGNVLPNFTPYSQWWPSCNCHVPNMIFSYIYRWGPYLQRGLWGFFIQFYKQEVFGTTQTSLVTPLGEPECCLSHMWHHIWSIALNCLQDIFMEKFCNNDNDSQWWSVVNWCLWLYSDISNWLYFK